MEAFSDIAPCGFIDVEQRFRRTFGLVTAIVIALVMDVVHTSETSVYFNDTIRHYIPVLHTRRRENLKPYHLSAAQEGLSFVELVCTFR
jgi:hypothetical protein